MSKASRAFERKNTQLNQPTRIRDSQAFGVNNIVVNDVDRNEETFIRIPSGKLDYTRYQRSSTSLLWSNDVFRFLKDIEKLLVNWLHEYNIRKYNIIYVHDPDKVADHLVPFYKLRRHNGFTNTEAIESLGIGVYFRKKNDAIRFKLGFDLETEWHRSHEI